MKIKKILALTAGLYALVGLALALAVLTTGGSASAGKHGPAGKSNVAHLYLHEKVPSGEWPIVEDGAWGKMKYNLSGSEFEYVFNGHGLVPDWNYTLIYYPDPWPGNNLICLGDGTANMYGDVHIMGSVDTGDLPTVADDNYPDGAKIWLVKSSDVECEATGWNLSGTWKFNYEYLGSYYEHSATIAQSGDTLSGDGGYPADDSPYQYHWNITSGNVTGNQVHLVMTYDLGVPVCTMTMDGTIASDGTLTNGAWSDDCWGIARNGTWVSSVGNATVVPLSNMMIGWDPTEYLFEYDLITFDDTDVP